jgi:hypothetical protein
MSAEDDPFEDKFGPRSQIAGDTRLDHEALTAAHVKKPCVEGPTKLEVRRFCLQRDVDVSGVSGVGVVAVGSEFTWRHDDKDYVRAVLVWLNEGTVGIYEGGTPQVRRIHGHEGATRIVFHDADVCV